MIQHSAERIDIGARADFAAAIGHLLRRQVLRRTEQLACGGQVQLGGQALGQAEIRDARLVEFIQENVRWLEVAVKNTALVCVVNRCRDLLDVTRRLLRRQRPALDEFG